MLEHKSKSLDSLFAAADVVYGQREQVGVVAHGGARRPRNHQPRTKPLTVAPPSVEEPAIKQGSNKRRRGL